MDKSGIYLYLNKINGKAYIGQSININKRYREHKNAAYNVNNKDYNLPIHRAIRKYGLDNFEFIILEECEQSELNSKEIYWIKQYDSYQSGYNATEGGNESHIHLGQPIEVYDLDGSYIREYPNITEAAKDIGVSRNVIYGILYGDRLSAKGCQFKLKKDTHIKIGKYSNRQGGKIPIKQYDKNNNFIQEWESAALAAKTLNLDASSITKCLKGKLKTCGNYIWKYKDK